MTHDSKNDLSPVPREGDPDVVAMRKIGPGEGFFEALPILWSFVSLC